VRWSAGCHEWRVRAPGMTMSGLVKSRNFLGTLGTLGWAFVGIVGADRRHCRGAYSCMYLYKIQ
jgi:hypothetical protein